MANMVVMVFAFHTIQTNTRTFEEIFPN